MKTELDKLEDELRVLCTKMDTLKKSQQINEPDDESSLLFSVTCDKDSNIHNLFNIFAKAMDCYVRINKKGNYITGKFDKRPAYDYHIKVGAMGKRSATDNDDLCTATDMFCLLKHSEFGDDIVITMTNRDTGETVKRSFKRTE